MARIKSDSMVLGCVREAKIEVDSSGDCVSLGAVV